MQRPTLFCSKTGVLLLLAVGVLWSQQEQKPAENKSAAPATAPAARLLSAKTALLKKTGSKDSIAYDVISITLEGWGRFTLVNAPENADLIFEVFSVEENGGGFSASSEAGGRRRSAGTSPVATALIKLTVYDAKTHIALWTGAERPKGALKKVDRENNEVEAAQRLASKLHDYIEPPQKQ